MAQEGNVVDGVHLRREFGCAEQSVLHPLDELAVLVLVGVESVQDFHVRGRKRAVGLTSSRRFVPVVTVCELTSGDAARGPEGTPEALRGARVQTLARHRGNHQLFRGGKLARMHGDGPSTIARIS